MKVPRLVPKSVEKFLVANGSNINEKDKTRNVSNSLIIYKSKLILIVLFYLIIFERFKRL